MSTDRLVRVSVRILEKEYQVACLPEEVTHRQAVNHERGGHRLGLFQDTPEVHALFRKTAHVAPRFWSEPEYFSAASRGSSGTRSSPTTSEALSLPMH